MRHSSVTRFFPQLSEETLLRWLVIVVLGLGLIGCAPPQEAPPPIPQRGLSPAWIHTLEESRRAVVDTPRSAEAWGRLGQRFQAADLPNPALSCYAQARALAPRDQRWWHLTGILQLLNQPDQGLKSLERAVDAATNESAASISRLVLAKGLLELARNAEAEGQLRSLLASNLWHAGARLEMARIEVLRDQLDAAEALLSGCTTNIYTARPALLLLSQIQQRRGKTEEAQRWSRQGLSMPNPMDWPDPILRDVLQLKESPTSLEDQINTLLIQGRLNEADGAISNLMARFPVAPTGPLLLGRMRFQQRRCIEAETALREHLRRSPDSLNGLMQLALALLCQERWTDSIAILRRAIELKPNSAQAHHNLGVATLRSGDAVQAVASFREALRYNPNDAGTCALLAEQLFKQGQQDEASRWMNRALELNPKQPRALKLRRQMEGPLRGRP